MTPKEATAILSVESQDASWPIFRRLGQRPVDLIEISRERRIAWRGGAHVAFSNEKPSRGVAECVTFSRSPDDKMGCASGHQFLIYEHGETDGVQGPAWCDIDRRGLLIVHPPVERSTYEWTVVASVMRHCSVPSCFNESIWK